MRALLFLILCLFVCLPVSGCDDAESVHEMDFAFDDQDLGNPEPDMALPDAFIEPDFGPPVPCLYANECPNSDCIDGTCAQRLPRPCDGETPCLGDETCSKGWCAKPCELTRNCPSQPHPCTTNRGCLLGSLCIEDRCINACLTDLDCPSEAYCNQGICAPFPADIFIGDAPSPLGQAEQLVAGAAVVPLNYPIGVSPAGYGAREGADTPYAKSLGGSDRVFEAQDVRAIVLSNDTDLLIVLRLPLSWSTDYIISRTAQKLQGLTVSDEHPNGINYLDKIVTGGTHSHSQPGRYWNLLPKSGFGVFGHGTFSAEMLDRYTTSFAQTIKAALDDVRPAQFGYTVVDSFDPEGRIHTDRRDESPAFIDDRMMVWQIQDMENVPIAGLVNFALHGTHMNETWLTGDAPGAVERILSEKLSAHTGHDVPVMFINGNAGNVSPRGDASSSVSWQNIQVVGHLVWPIFQRLWDTTATSPELSMQVLHRRIPIDYDRLGYDFEASEFQDIQGRPQIYGGFQCVQQSRAPDEPPYMDGELSCLLSLHNFPGWPVVQIHKTVLSVFQLNDLVVTTMPGEPTSELGMDLSGLIEADAEAAGTPVKVMNFGYSQDHHLYLVTEEDWFHGGYEAAQNMWGWRLGNYLIGQSQALASQLFTAEIEDNSNDLKPTWFTDLEDDTVPPTAATESVGEIVMDAPETLRRDQVLEVRWIGGHPGVDQPLITVEHEVEGAWIPAERPAGLLTWDNGGFESVTIYLGDFAGDHVWAVRWEFPFEYPTGRYRLRITGAAFNGTTTDAYEIADDRMAFELIPAPLVIRVINVADNGRIEARVNYPGGATNATEAGPFELAPMGHLYRLRPNRRLSGAAKQYSYALGEALDSGVIVAVTLTGDSEKTARQGVVDDTVDFELLVGRDEADEETIVQIAGWPSSRVRITHEPGAYVLSVEDAYGNRGEVPVVIP